MTTTNVTNTNNPVQISQVLYGEETAKALVNFTISEMKMPRAFLWALGEVKSAAAIANMELGLLEPDKAMAIKLAAQSVANGFYDDQFPVDVFQTGSGTSTNMNANEVIASLVALQSEGKLSVHPLDEVNLGQSSNDVIPSLALIHI